MTPAFPEGLYGMFFSGFRLNFCFQISIRTSYKVVFLHTDDVVVRREVIWTAGKYNIVGNINLGDGLFSIGTYRTI